MSSLRSDLVGVVDAGRQLVADLGFRRRTVTVRTRTWTGPIGKAGSTYVDADVVLTPPPKVAEPPARLVNDAVGGYEAGDLLVTRISAGYAETALGDTGSATIERFYLVTHDDVDAAGDTAPRPYRLKAAPTLRSFGWEVTLSRINRKAGP